MNRINKLFRRMTAAAVCVAALVSLTACGSDPAETTAPPETVKQTLPAVTQPPQTTPPTTQPVETTLPPIDYDGLVSDAHCYVYRDDYGYEYCYHIPRVNLESCASINNEIYSTMTQILDQDVHDSVREYGEPMIGDMTYTWGHRENVVSILVAIGDMYSDGVTRYIYYLSPESGAQLEKAALLAAFGLSEDDFYGQVYDYLAAYWDEMLQSEAFQSMDYMQDMAGQMIDDTLDDENIHSAIPFIQEDGRLAFIVTIFVPAGGGEYQAVIDFETGEHFYHSPCTIDHSNEP